ncbi:hypothetical protein [Phosphitispora fastidiosa]|uniref:hypothetical protein n=1 Tax=Phosphitispora fastidiosa TaxID=2837202 RepID=UPI001E33C054|nr:hypothetical protein [Phosphitispora fastidiosa]MBU7006176.1 hypothetical protein [Phosphitispora fastidiosa]
MSGKIPYDDFTGSKFRTKGIRKLTQSDDFYGIAPLADILEEVLSKLFNRSGFDVSFWLIDTFSKNTRVQFTLKPTVGLIDVITSVDVFIDQYLIETLNAMNLLYFHNASECDYVKYLNKLTADECFSVGLIAETLKIIRTYTSLKYNFSDNLDKSIVSKAISFAALQQIYIILHEFAHVLLKCEIVKDSRFLFVKEQVLTLLKNNSPSVTDSEINNFISKNIKLFDECYCDSFAIETIFVVVNDLDREYTYCDVCEALFLALNHLHIIETVKDIVLGREIDLSLQLVIRQLFLESYMPTQGFRRLHPDLFLGDSFRACEKSSDKDIIIQTDKVIESITDPFIDKMVAVSAYYSNINIVELLHSIMSEPRATNIMDTDGLAVTCSELLKQLI